MSKDICCMKEGTWLWVSTSTEAYPQAQRVLYPQRPQHGDVVLEGVLQGDALRLPSERQLLGHLSAWTAVSWATAPGCPHPPTSRRQPSEAPPAEPHTCLPSTPTLRVPL